MPVCTHLSTVYIPFSPERNSRTEEERERIFITAVLKKVSRTEYFIQRTVSGFQMFTSVKPMVALAIIYELTVSRCLKTSSITRQEGHQNRTDKLASHWIIKA